jgi:ATPase subunit of ABC transporter with duplicated ATPase domains
LAAFDGTLITVTHDRWFMKAADRFLVFAYDCSVVEARDLDDALRKIG